jgi:hypothetical protein
MVEDRSASDQAVARIAALARDDASALVRVYVASALQRLPAARRWDAVAGLIAHAEDAEDHNQPLMVWYAAEPLAALDPARALALATEARLPRLRPYTIQRIAALGTPDALRVLAERLARTADPAEQAELVSGLSTMVKK